MNGADFLSRLVAILDEACMPYMLSGSMVSTLFGEPRATQDIDIVIAPTMATMEALLDRLPEDAYYADAATARAALRARSQFNIIDMATGWKADLIVRKARRFSVVEFSRRVEVQMLGVDVFVASPEDIIIAKLEWAKRGGGSERQLRDVRGVLQAQEDLLDIAYIEAWVDELGLRAEWNATRGGC